METKVRMTRGKFNGINAVADKHGIIAALAMDQRGSLKKAISQIRDHDVSNAELSEFKMVVAQVLTPYTSAILLDPEYALDAIQHCAKGVGLLLAYEKSGYDPTVKGRIPSLLDGWSVKRLVEVGANAIKVVIYYDPNDDAQINMIKHAFVERIGAECKAHDVPFFLELLSYDDKSSGEKGFEFACIKPGKVKATMQEFSKSQYEVDVLKVEVPVNVHYVEKMKANTTGRIAYSQKEAKQYFREAALASKKPFIYLSAGVGTEVFLETMELAVEAGTPFSGVLCGRATWQNSIPAYVRGGASALRIWLEDQGIHNIQALNRVLARGARPWWDFYGGKDAIEIIGGIENS